METGNVIREYRTLRGMTQEELAAALLVTPQAVSRWETGVSYPDIVMIPEIVKVLGVSADELLGCAKRRENQESSERPPVSADESLRHEGLTAERKGRKQTPDYPASVASVQEAGEKILNQSQIDSIFDYVPKPDPASKSVLIIDDADFMRMMVTDILSRQHRVLQARSGNEGLEILRGEACGGAVDVCILDIRMPGMNGLEVLEAIKRDNPEQKVIMLSAMRTEETVKKALALGADSFVAKPFQASTLVERV